MKDQKLMELTAAGTAPDYPNTGITGFPFNASIIFGDANPYRISKLKNHYGVIITVLLFISQF
jgi:hypothetical protein